MTRAAAPAVNGEDWLVPPKTCRLARLPLLSVQSKYCGSPLGSNLSEQVAQPRSPGASRSGTRLVCVMLPDDREESWSLTYLPLLNWKP